MGRGRRKGKRRGGIAGLHGAALAGDAAGAERLLGAGADPDEPDAEGLTPLVLAVLAGRTALVGRLLDAGADPGAPAGERAARALSDPAVAGRYGLGRGPHAGETPLMLAARLGKHQAVERLLEGGAAPDAADPLGARPLMHAAGQGNRQVLAALLRHGADPDRPDQQGCTALITAAARGDGRMVEALLAAGARADHVTAHGGSALVEALQGGRDGLAQLLRDHGALQPPAEFGPLEIEAARELLRGLKELGEPFFLELRALPTATTPGWPRGDPPLINALMLHLGLRGLGARWNPLSAARAPDLLVALMSHHLVFSHPLRGARHAPELARQFLALLPAARLYSNVSAWGPDGQTHSAVSWGGFDAAVIALGERRVAALWTEQED